LGIRNFSKFFEIFHFLIFHFYMSELLFAPLLRGAFRDATQAPAQTTIDQKQG
jgi:hypothetical protein